MENGCRQNLKVDGPKVINWTIETVHFLHIGWSIFTNAEQAWNYLHMIFVILFLFIGWIFFPFLHVKVHTFILKSPPPRFTYLQFVLKSWLFSSGDISAQFSQRQICLLHLKPSQFETHFDARFWIRSVFRRWCPSSHFANLQVEPAQLYMG